MSQQSGGALQGIELDDDRYTVVQSLIRSKYKAMDSAGNVVLRGKKKRFKLKEEFPFVDADGNDVFSIKAGGILDVAGNYVLTDSVTDEPVIVLDRNWTLFTDVWKLRDPDTEAVVATIESKNKLVSVLRHFVGVLSLLPHTYEITDADGDHVGSIDGKFSLKDTYDVVIDGDTSDVPREAIVAAAMVIDAIEEN